MPKYIGWHQTGPDRPGARDRNEIRGVRFTTRFSKSELAELTTARRLNDLRSFGDGDRLAWDAPQLSGLVRYWSLLAARALIKTATAAELARVKKETRTL